jgi:hypothetical protein
MLLVRVLKPSVGRAGRIADMRGSVIRQEGGVLLRYVARGILSELTGTKVIGVTGKHKVPVQPCGSWHQNNNNKQSKLTSNNNWRGLFQG